MNELIPFNYGQFQTKEAVYNTDPLEWVKRYRFTRKAIGQFLHREAKDPQKVIDKILERKPHLKALSIPVTVTGKHEYKQKGHIPVTVTGICPPERIIEYEVETYDIFGLYQIAVESDLPQKKEFLIRFPDWLLALQRGKIRPALPPTAKHLIAMQGFKDIDETPRGHKVDTMDATMEPLGKARSTGYKWKATLRDTGTLNYKYHEGQIKRLMREKFPLWGAILKDVRSGKQQRAVARKFGVSDPLVSRVVRVYAVKYGEYLNEQTITE